MGSLLAEGNKKAKANQNIRWLKKICFYGFREVKFLFKTFKRIYSKSLALLFEAHTHAECQAKNNKHSIHLPSF
ncbi:hypothetical protein Hpkin27_13910 [Helicobacter pylori]